MTTKPKIKSKARPQRHVSRHGWDLFRFDGTLLLRIEKVDDAGVFSTDDDAIAHARHLAAKGNAFAKNAVQIHDRDSPKIESLLALRRK